MWPAGPLAWTIGPYERLARPAVMDHHACLAGRHFRSCPLPIFHTDLLRTKRNRLATAGSRSEGVAGAGGLVVFATRVLRLWSLR